MHQSTVVAAENSLVAQLAWPVVVILAVLVLALPRSSPVRAVGRRLAIGNVKVSAFGTQVELTPQTKTATERALDEALSEFRSSTQALYRQVAHEQNVVPHFRSLFRQLEVEIRRALDLRVNDLDRTGQLKSLRAGLYVDHALLRDYLIQLAPYQPGGGGFGRAFSTRFGIIGLAWRSEKSICDSLATDQTEKEKQLIERYGMSVSEAQAGRKSKGNESFAALIVKNSADFPVLGVFLDADGRDLFDDEMVGNLTRITERSALVSVVEIVQQRVRALVPQVRLPDDQHI